MHPDANDRAQFENTTEVIAFRLFAEEELSKLPNNKIDGNDVVAVRNLRIVANDFQSLLIYKRLGLLSNRKLNQQPSWTEMNDYMEQLEFGYKEQLMAARLSS